MLRIVVSSGFVSLAFLAACSSDDSSSAPASTTGSSSVTAGPTGSGGAAGSTSGSGSTGGGAAGGPSQMDAAREGAMADVACPSYKPDSCGGTCTDVKADPDHCGSCTVRCDPGAPCDNGSCGAAPTTVVPSAPGCDALQIAWADGRLYWTDQGHGTVESISTTGGTRTSLATGQKAPRAILVAGGAVYWINGGDNTVVRASLGEAGAPMAVATAATDAGADALGAIAVSGTTLYYAVLDRIYRTGVTGGAPTLVGIAQQSGVVSALAFDAANLYYPTKIHNDVEIMSLSPSPDGGSQTSRVAESQGGLYFDTITVTGSLVYWGNNESLRVGSTDHGKNTRSVASTASFGPVTGFVIGTTDAYIAEGADGADLGFVEKAPLDPDAADPNGTARIIARGQKAPNSLALDATRVYWSTREVGGDAGASGCAIMSRAQ